ncbi:MAG: diaminopimelate epimerase [Desulfurellaceae bacterium]|nr:diaminopimelate epimerase [Desulfurellaceae bacterium]
MRQIEFWKMNGSGNDFIIIDNRSKMVEKTIDVSLKQFIVNICRRRLSIGANGIILVENDDALDFAWRFFNNDGSEVEMCGNGSRCVARFAYEKGIAKDKMCFRTQAGPIHAWIVDKNRVKVELTKPSSFKKIDINGREGYFINTGVPHVVYLVENVENIDIMKIGRETRYSKMFKQGTNVNFMKIIGEKSIIIRTYERGVEGETLACGTGSVASVLIGGALGMLKTPVLVKTRGGEELTVYFQGMEKVMLEGKTNSVYRGVMSDEAWR